jgi:hypothetical protein
MGSPRPRRWAGGGSPGGRCGAGQPRPPSRPLLGWKARCGAAHPASPPPPLVVEHWPGALVGQPRPWRPTAQEPSPSGRPAHRAAGQPMWEGPLLFRHTHPLLGLEPWKPFKTPPPLPPPHAPPPPSPAAPAGRGRWGTPWATVGAWAAPGGGGRGGSASIFIFAVGELTTRVFWPTPNS